MNNFVIAAYYCWSISLAICIATILLYELNPKFAMKINNPMFALAVTVGIAGFVFVVFDPFQYFK